MATDHDLDSMILDSELDDNDDPLNLCDPHPDNKYITVDELNNFFNFKQCSAINIMHINCRSLKKNYGPLN